MDNQTTSNQVWYAKYVLPHFGALLPITWGEVQQVGPDDVAFHFDSEQTNYILIWEDAGGNALNTRWVSEKVTDRAYDVVASDYPENNRVWIFRLPDGTFIPQTTGVFTLLRLR